MEGGWRFERDLTPSSMSRKEQGGTVAFTQFLALPTASSSPAASSHTTGTIKGTLLPNLHATFDLLHLPLVVVLIGHVVSKPATISCLFKDHQRTRDSINLFDHRSPSLTFCAC